MVCDYCGSSIPVERRVVEDGANTYTVPVPSGDRIPLCRVCSRLLGTRTGHSTLDDINRNIVILFHTLGLVPHSPDDEEGTV